MAGCATAGWARQGLAKHGMAERGAVWSGLQSLLRRGHRGRNTSPFARHCPRWSMLSCKLSRVRLHYSNGTAMSAPSSKTNSRSQRRCIASMKARISSRARKSLGRSRPNCVACCRGCGRIAPWSWPIGMKCSRQLWQWPIVTCPSCTYRGASPAAASMTKCAMPSRPWLTITALRQSARIGASTR